MAFVVAIGVAVAVMAGAILWALAGHDGDAAWFYLPRNATASSVADSLRVALGESEGSKVYNLWRLQGGDAAKAHGAYRVEPGQSALRTARRMATGAQTPVRLTFNNIRTLPQLRSAHRRHYGVSDRQLHGSSIKSARGRGICRA